MRTHTHTLQSPSFPDALELFLSSSVFLYEGTRGSWHSPAFLCFGCEYKNMYRTYSSLMSLLVLDWFKYTGHTHTPYSGMYTHSLQ